MLVKNSIVSIVSILSIISKLSKTDKVSRVSMTNILSKQRGTILTLFIIPKKPYQSRK